MSKLCINIGYTVLNMKKPQSLLFYMNIFKLKNTQL